MVVKNIEVISVPIRAELIPAVIGPEHDVILVPPGVEGGELGAVPIFANGAKLCAKSEVVPLRFNRVMLKSKTHLRSLPG